MFDFIGNAKKALDAFAQATRIRIVPDPLWHPGGDEVCLLEVPGYRQIESYTCGFVAGAMILHTFHPGACLKTFFEQCTPGRASGLDTEPLIRCLRANRIGVSVKRELTFKQIAAALDHGYPILTLTRTPRPNEVHWVVLFGYGKNPNRVFMAGEGLPVLSSLMGQKEVLWSEFSRSKWAQRGFGLVCWGK
ncbi:C39 family peptidase [Roseimicrobium sp. ORNL1]|uniref:C39 family peptidase n=1 Tax=Roseimicrobium sp. ORNL1 TaxID=2711231 RepID=UPI0013E102D5|nr:C39 family peptidase [Roseimicrobium sp. ORNL1]QIF02843.1 hypothetical protein G5S37_15380 [Roseimicrobium sp. ORNL1]